MKLDRSKAWWLAKIAREPNVPIGAGSTRDNVVENGVLMVRPTIWHRLGYRYRWDEDLFSWRSADPEPGDWFVPGTITTRIAVNVSFLDRLRLLISGRCELSCYTRTNVTVDHAETRSQFAVLAP